MNNTPITDAALAELRRLHATAPTGTWLVGKNKASGRVQIHNGQHQVCAVWHTAAHPARETAEAIASTHNALPGIFALIEDLQAYRDEVEAARPTVQALLDSGERAASEVADLRQRLEAAEELAASIQNAKALAARDARMKREGAAEWLEKFLAEWDTDATRDLVSIWDIQQAAKRLREGGE